MMIRTYYECINEAGKPATERQAAKLGAPGYGYSSRIRAELACPNGCIVAERHCDNGDDWGGRIVSMRAHCGTLIRLVG